MDEIDDNSTSPSTDVQDLSSQEADIIAESVSEYSTLLKDSLAKMAAAIPSQDETEFIMALDTIDSCTKGLYESLKDVKSAEKVCFTDLSTSPLLIVFRTFILSMMSSMASRPQLKLFIKTLSLLSILRNMMMPKNK